MYETIKVEADKRNKSVRQLERESGLGNGTIDKWKESSPTLESLEKVAGTLGMDVTTLIKRARKKNT